MGQTDPTGVPVPTGDSFGTLLKHYRLAAGLTQEALAAEAGLSIRGISDLERGVIRAPRSETLRLLADALMLSHLERTKLVAQAARPGRPAPPREAQPDAIAPTLPPLVGREYEVAALRAFLAGEGQPVLLLTGPPGIGKSRLLQEAGDRAEAAGWRVLAAGGRRRGGQEPFAPIAAALEHRIAALSPVELRAALRGCAWLVRLLPELADGPIEPLPAWQVSPEHERRLMFRAVARFLVNVAGPAGTLLVLDDLQWAGTDALDLLAALAQPQAAGLAPTMTAALRVVGAYRNTEVGPRDAFALLLADLLRAALVTHRTLGPLADADARCLLAALLPGDAGSSLPPYRERIVRSVGGVPFLLVSWARHMREGSPNGSAAEDIPWDLGQSIRQQVAVLPDGAREILSLAAIAGRESSGTLLIAAAGRPSAAVLESLEAVCRAGLLQETEEGSYRFAHDVLHEVVESGIGAMRRRHLHQHLAATLERQLGEPAVEALAYHYLRAGDWEKAALYLEQAGDRAATRHADAAAEGYYGELEGLQERLGWEQAAAAGREKLAVVLTRRSRYDEALAVLERAAETYRRLADWTGLARVTARQGALHAEIGSCEKGLRLVRPLVALLEPLGPSPELAHVYMALLDLAFHSGDLAGQLAAGERAVAIARVVGDDLLLAHALVARGGAFTWLPRTTEALADLEEALRLLEANGEPVDLSAIRLYVPLAVIHFFQGRQREGLRFSARALEAAEQFGDPRYIAWVLSERGNMRTYLGEWAGAREDQERSVALHRQIGLSHGSADALAALGKLRLLEGALEEATRLLEEAISLSQRSGNAVWIWQCRGRLAEIERRAGRPAEARARLRALLADPLAPECHPDEFSLCLARACLSLGAVEEADEALEGVAERARADGDPLLLRETLEIQALVATRRGEWHAAERWLEEGLFLAGSVTAPYGQGGLLHAYGLLHRACGKDEPARERLAAALAIFKRLGACKDIEWVEADLTSLRQQPRA